MSKNIKEDKIIKETKYCKIINQGKVGDDEYTYTIEKIYIKELKRNEISNENLEVRTVKARNECR